MAILPEGWNLPIVGFSLVEDLRSTAVLLRLVIATAGDIRRIFPCFDGPCWIKKSGVNRTEIVICRTSLFTSKSDP